MTKHKKSNYICDKMQKDRIQIFQMQDTLQMWQNTKQHIAKMTKYEMTDDK